MTTKDAFSTEEWQKIATLDEAIGLMMINAEPGGLLSENRTLWKTIGEATELFPNDELIAAVAARSPDDRPSTEEHGRLASGDAPDSSGAEVYERVDDVMAILQQKATPEEVEHFKRYLYHVAEQVASRHKEGGFLGIGGQPISPREQSELDQIRAALGLST
jgi:hypothetical protein